MSPTDSATDLARLLDAARADFAAATTPPQLEDAKARYLGKAGAITAQLKALGGLDPEARKAAGAGINVVKQAIESALNERRDALARAALDARLSAEALDVTLPGRRRPRGGLHPVSMSIARIESIFGSMGFDVADGPEIETDWMSFTALNNPENHPARSMQDTFYVDMNDSEGRPYNLRPHTSPMQVRYARAHAQKHAAALQAGQPFPDVRVIAPGRTYRVDSDATHSPMFHQVEGLWMGQDVSFQDLKSVFLQFFQAFFETEDLQLRFRPSFFPFTEPSAEVDIAFSSGPLKGRWLEVAGSGQVHPNVVRHFGFEPENTIGFAFGMGPDRLTMLRYGVNDLRQFYESDLRFLASFAA
ncbi:phenylalanine--tRNA ligase subunit alpha [Amphibiibacter pelophylacis]|uniref:Phenylalanine--tRNA ligase subunit alpha n=1 Tax=Amphibiibacter pelophylacis TaxID=1799477 RepID=A0ACC6P3I2_9BURK